MGASIQRKQIWIINGGFEIVQAGILYSEFCLLCLTGPAQGQRFSTPRLSADAPRTLYMMVTKSLWAERICYIAEPRDFFKEFKLMSLHTLFLRGIWFLLTKQSSSCNLKFFTLNDGTYRCSHPSNTFLITKWDLGHFKNLIKLNILKTK